MSLTGPSLAWLAVSVTLAAFAALVGFWPRLAGPRAGPVILRVVGLLVVNVLVLLTAAVQLNDRYAFFAGWTDLQGAAFGPPGTVSRLEGGGSARVAAAARVAAPFAAVAPGAPLPLPAGSRVADGVTAYRVRGALSGITAEVLVSLPPGYADAGSARRYPVLETFSGYPGSVTQWVRTMRLRDVLAAGTATHRIGPTVVVSPQIEIPAGVDTECVDGRPGQPRLETWLARDVPDWVAAHFRVRTDRGAWATIGLSAGGWCAAMVSMLHPAQFGAAVVLGGYFRPLFEPSFEPFTAGSAAARRYDLVALARRSPPPLAVWLETSHADPLSYTSSAALLRAAHAPLSVTATVLQDAGHRIGVWRDLLPAALGWLSTNLPGFRAP
jgi:S-formylglutathione hydrolase FrmB